MKKISHKEAVVAEIYIIWQPSSILECALMRISEDSIDGMNIHQSETSHLLTLFCLFHMVVCCHMDIAKSRPVTGVV